MSAVTPAGWKREMIRADERPVAPNRRGLEGVAKVTGVAGPVVPEQRFARVAGQACGRPPNILSKMGANDRTHAAILGIKRRIIA
jgi:hypothetical protein